MSIGREESTMKDLALRCFNVKKSGRKEGTSKGNWEETTEIEKKTKLLVLLEECRILEVK